MASDGPSLSGVDALLARARALLEGAEEADDATRLKALEDLHNLLEEQLDRGVEQNPPRH